MKAVRLHAYGGPNGLRYEDAPRPVPAAGEVLVRVHAAAVNPVDWKIREGYLRGFLPLTLPHILGADVAGTVVEAAPNVTEFAPGEAVYGVARLHRDGAYAEFVALPVDMLAPKPASLSFVEAAALPIGVLTAWQALEKAGLRPGQSVLVQGAAGGVGSQAVQLARALGAGRVVGTASGRNADFVRSLGADEVLDYRTQRFEEALAPVDVVLDAVGGEVQRRSFQVLKPGGYLISVVGPPPAPELAAQYGVQASQLSDGPDGARLRQLNELVAAGKIRPVVETVLPLTDYERALNLSQHGPVRGKIVLTVAS